MLMLIMTLTLLVTSLLVLTIYPHTSNTNNKVNEQYCHKTESMTQHEQATGRSVCYQRHTETYKNTPQTKAAHTENKAQTQGTQGRVNVHRTGETHAAQCDVDTQHPKQKQTTSATWKQGHQKTHARAQSTRTKHNTQWDTIYIHIESRWHRAKRNRKQHTRTNSTQNSPLHRQKTPGLKETTNTHTSHHQQHTSSPAHTHHQTTTQTNGTRRNTTRVGPQKPPQKTQKRHETGKKQRTHTAQKLQALQTPLEPLERQEPQGPQERKEKRQHFLPKKQGRTIFRHHKLRHKITRYRPTHPSGGIRFGEAKNPGPTPTPTDSIISQSNTTGTEQPSGTPHAQMGGRDVRVTDLNTTENMSRIHAKDNIRNEEQDASRAVEMSNPSLQSPESPLDSEDWTPTPDLWEETATGVIEGLEEIWKFDTDWKKMPEGTPIDTHLRDAWKGIYHLIHTSKLCNAVRLIRALQTGRLVVHYFTLKRVWGFHGTLSRTSPDHSWNREEAVNLTPETTDLLWPYMVSGLAPHQSLETIFSLMDLAAQRTESARDPIQLYEIKRSDFPLPLIGPEKYTFTTCTANGHCLICPEAQTHHTTVRIKYLTKNFMHLSCTNNQSAAHFRKINPKMAETLFIERIEEQGPKRKKTTETRSRAANPKRTTPDLTLEDSPPEIDTLRVMSWNADKQIKEKLKALMSYVKDRKIHAIGLQEVENLPVDAERDIERNGYILYRHEKVAILLHAETAGVRVDAADVWRSKTFNSMSVTLTTAKGSLLLVAAYLPTGIDNASEEEKYVAIQQHMEINARTTEYAQAIVMMDGNETAHTNGRIHIHDPNLNPEEPNPRSTQQEQSTTRQEETQRTKVPEQTTMGCYTTHMQIAGPPNRDEQSSHPTYTNVQTRNGLSIHAELDYIWISKRLADRVKHHEVDNAPREWRNGKTNKNYHKAVTLEIQWPSIWTSKTKMDSNTETKEEELKGDWIALGPDLRRANPETDAEFSRKIEEALTPQWKTLRNTFLGRLPPQRKLDILYNTYQKLHLKTAYKVYGQRKQHPTPNKPNVTEASEAWDTSYKTIVQFIKKHKDTHTGTPSREALDKLSDTIKAQTDILRERGHTLPPVEAWEDLQKWAAAKDYNRGQMLGRHDAYGITDAEAIANPKKLTKAVCKPPGSSTIHSLRKGNEILVNDVELEKEFTSFLTNLGGQKENILDMKDHPAREKTQEGKTRTLHTHLKGLVAAKVELSEIQATLADLSSTVAAAELPPHLVKTAATKPWTHKITKSTKQIMREERQRKWETEMGLEAPSTQIELTTEVKIFPTRSIKLLRMIVEIAFKARNIPAPEKTGTITPLPKNGPEREGPISSILHIRPITVSPILGRIINNILAKRLAGALEKYKILNQSQFAFLPGRNIHQAIASIKHCFAQSNRAQNGAPGRACFAVFYDISKAYDTVRWSSIQNALINIGAPDDFIDFVMHCLQGTELCMKTNIPGRVTPTVQMHKAIKQGCPLAPILFTIVMNDLHERCSKIGGYTLRSEGTTPVTLASRGFCDDTAILAEDFETLQKLNSCVAEFFAEHGFQLSATKTYLVGRETDGNSCTRPLYWPGQTEPINPRETSYAVRYLGIWMSLDLSWTTQIAKMSASIMGLVSHIKHKRITLLQAAIIIRYVMGKKMEIGFRHATISSEQLKTWDRWLKDAVVTRVEVPLPKLHSCSVMPILKTLDLEKTYVLDKSMDILEKLIKESEMQAYYQNCFKQAKNKVKGSDKGLMEDLDRLGRYGIHLKENESWRSEEKVLRSRHGTEEILISGEKIPIRNTENDYRMWGSSYKKDDAIEVVMCTDGSADPRHLKQRAGAAVVYLDDKFAQDEYDNTHQLWTIQGTGNYEAEMAAINKAIRSIPITTHAIIYTDSLSALMALETFIRTGGATAPLACSARPYLRAAAKAKELRTKIGTRTIIRHVRAHTGARDPPSVGNEAADRRAKTALHAQEETNNPGLDLMQHELQFIACIGEKESPNQEADPEGEEKEEPKCIHGNVRRTLRNHLRETLLDEWATRKVRGELIKKYRKGAIELIDHVWRAPTTNKLTMLLDAMNQADRKLQGTSTCGRCGKETKDDITHRILTCPTTAEAWNDAEIRAWAVITPIQDEPPTTTTTFRAKQHSTQYRLDKLGTTRPLNPGATPFYPTSAALTKIATMMAHAEMDMTTRKNTEQARELAAGAKKAAETAKESAKKTVDIVNKTLETVAEALDLIGEWMTKHTNAEAGAEEYGKEASTLKSSDFTIGHVVAVVGRELTGQGPGKKRNNTTQEIIHETTQVRTPGVQEAPPGQNRALRHHVWWGVVAAKQGNEEASEEHILLKWLAVSPPQRRGVRHRTYTN